MLAFECPCISSCEALDCRSPEETTNHLASNRLSFHRVLHQFSVTANHKLTEEYSTLEHAANRLLRSAENSGDGMV